MNRATRTRPLREASDAPLCLRRHRYGFYRGSGRVDLSFGSRGASRAVVAARRLLLAPAGASCLLTCSAAVVVIVGFAIIALIIVVVGVLFNCYFCFCYHCCYSVVTFSVVIIFFVVVVIYTVMTGLLVVIITSGLTKSYLRRRQDCFSVCFPLLPPFFFISPEICMKMLLSGRPFPPGRGGVGAVVFDGDVFCPGCGGCYFCCCCHCFHSAIVIGFCASLGGGGGWRYMSPTAP